jgi:hypothetical protein
MNDDPGTAGLTAPTSRRASPARLRLALIAGALLVGLGLVVALARRAPTPERNRFDNVPLRVLKARKPDYVLIGNSMVFTRFDEPLLARLLAPRRVQLIALGYSYSAMWYAMFKNYVVASGRHPRRVLFFFRELDLTSPLAGTEGDGAWRLQRVSLREEPVIEERLRPRWTDPIERLRHTLDEQVPVKRLRSSVEPWLDAFGLWLAGVVDPGADAVQKDHVNAAFAADQLRPTSDVSEVPERAPERVAFSELVESSFLPDIVALASEHKIPIAFVRVRKRWAAEGEPESEASRSYQAELRAYLEARGVPLYDMTHAGWEAKHMYGRGDHIAFKYKRRYTQLFVRHMRHVFD